VEIPVIRSSELRRERFTGKGLKMGSSFKIVLTGLQFRQDRREVRDKLAKLFKADSDRVEQLLTKAPASVKSGLSMETALKYQKAIQDCGAECLVKSEDE
jgi:hypothetical protein